MELEARPVAMEPEARPVAAEPKARPVETKREPAEPEPPATASGSQTSLPLSGTVVAHGGGPMGRTTMGRFATLCEHGKLVLIPGANPKAGRRRYRRRVARYWQRQDFSAVAVLHTDRREDADRDAFIAPLREADCVWLGGGDQGRLIRRYVGTRVEDELHALLRRGGTVGGYSAGTAIMTEVMIRRGNPVPVEDHGFGLLPGIIFDQHFVARNREPRLRAMLERHPSLVGFGIDEGTALVVSGDAYRVIGESVVRRCTHRAGCRDLVPGDTGHFPREG